jgi:type IV pilus assembly protein PilQ
MVEFKKDNCMKTESKILFGVLLVLALSLVAVGAGQSQQSIFSDGKITEFNCEEGLGIRSALAQLGGLCSKNIVPSQSVDGKLAFRTLKNVTFEEAMNAILGEGFVYEQQGNLVKVYTKDEYKKIKEDEGRMIHKVFTLYYITSEEAATLIKPVMSSKAKIEKSSAAEKDITSGSTSSGSVSGGSSGGSGGGDKMALNDTIVVYDYPENIEKAADILKKLDKRPTQVMVEATILSAVLTEGTKFGIDWNFAGGVGLAGASATSDLVSGDTVSRGTTATTPIGQIAQNGWHQGLDGSPIETSGFASTAMNGLRMGVTTGNMAAFITALEEVTDVTILANPKILAVNKQQGYVQIGKTLHYRGATTIGQSGVASQGEDKALPTGTVLSFRPFIGNDGYIRMDISPKDSTATINANGLPDETTAEVKTNIVVKDGETIVIGGLFRDVVTTGRSQIPILGDLPLVGVLFRGTNDKTERQEVMVLLTPRIIEEPSETGGQERAADISRKRTAAKEGLQWIDRSRLAEDAYSRAVARYMEDDKEAAMRELALALNLRPTYLEAVRLKERILSEVSPEEAKNLERVLLEKADQKDASGWVRR